MKLLFQSLIGIMARITEAPKTGEAKTRRSGINGTKAIDGPAVADKLFAAD